VAQKGEGPPRPMSGGGDPLVVINVEQPTLPPLPKGGVASAPPPPTGNSAEKPKTGTTPTAGQAKPKGNGQPTSASPQTTSR